MHGVRYVRQMLVREIGPAGQERIARGVAEVAGVGLAYDVACRYATRAGFGRIATHPDGLPTVSYIFLSHEAGAIAAGSLLALRAIRSVVKP